MYGLIHSMPLGSVVPNRNFQYLEGLVLRTPDLYLHELQRELLDTFGVDVALNTITLVLKGRGFSRKKVRYCAILYSIADSLYFRLHVKLENARRQYVWHI